MAVGLLTKNAKLFYKTDTVTSFTELKDCQSIGEVGGSKETVEITRLTDSQHTYIVGLGDQSSLECKFLYGIADDDSFPILYALDKAGKMVDWKVELPDGSNFTFSGNVGVKVDSLEPNNAITFTATLTISSDMVWAKQ